MEIFGPRKREGGDFALQNDKRRRELDPKTREREREIELRPNLFQFYEKNAVLLRTIHLKVLNIVTYYKLTILINWVQIFNLY